MSGILLHFPAEMVKGRTEPRFGRNHLTVFVNALIENPAFDSQTKETLTTRPRNFGSSCQLSIQFLDEILEKTQIVDIVQCATSNSSRSMLI